MNLGPVSHRGTMSTARLAKLPHHVLVEFAARACENSGVLKSEADALLARHIPPLPQWCVEVLHLPDVLLCCMRHATPADLSAAAACCSTWRPIVQDAVAMHPAAEGLMAGKSNPTVARLHRVIDGLQRASQLADRLQEIDATPGTPYARSQILLGLALLAACDDTRGCLRLRLAKEHFTAICRLLDELGPEQPLEAFDFAFEIFMAMDLPRDPDCVLLAHKYVLPRLALRVPFRKSGLSKRSAWQLLASLPPAWLEEHALPLLLPYIQGEVQPSVHSRGGPLEVLASLSQATIMRHVALVMTLLEDSFELAETETRAAGERQSEALYAGCMSLAVLVRLPPAWLAERAATMHVGLLQRLTARIQRHPSLFGFNMLGVTVAYPEFQDRPSLLDVLKKIPTALLPGKTRSLFRMLEVELTTWLYVAPSSRPPSSRTRSKQHSVPLE